MRIDVLSLFPGMFTGPLTESIVKRAKDKGLVDIRVHNIRDYTHDAHHTADDYPYGGGAGMVLKPEPIFEALDALKAESDLSGVPVILLTPQGRLFRQEIARELSSHSRLVLICGHYEGVDERVREQGITDEISIGDYVLSNGEIPAFAVIDAIVRLIPGALGSEASLLDESHTSGLLEYPHYTRPPEYRGWQVPAVLLSGDHGKIAAWRHQQSLQRTLRQRPDLLAQVSLSDEDRITLDKLRRSDN